MASRSLGTLTMDLIAKIGGFEAGLDKAEREAKKRAKAIEKVFDAAGTAAGFAFGTAVTVALSGAAVFDRLIKQIGDFQDIAEKTGGSAEGFASFAIALGTTNTAVETLASASQKLSKGLTGVDDESKAAGAALSALGLNIDEFKALAPEDQIETISKALAGFEDGAQKTAVAMALFGKSGAELLPFLKELEQQGGRQIVLTAEQIKLADEYADNQARVAAQLKQYAQVLAVQVLPIVTATTQAAVDFAKSIIGIDDSATDLQNNKAVTDFAEGVARGFAMLVDAGDLVIRIFQGVGSAIAALLVIQNKAMSLQFGDAVRTAKNAASEIDRIFSAPTFGSKLDARLAAQRADRANFDGEARRRGGRGTGLASLNFEGAQKKDKASKEKQNEADRYLESLQKQLQKTADLTVAETVLADIASGRLGKVTDAQKASILLTAKQIDAAKEHEQVLKDMRAASIAEGDAVLKANEAYQSRLKTLMDATPSAILEKQRADVKLLTEEYEAARITEAEYLEAVSARLDLVADKTKETNDFAKDLGLTFTSAFEDAVVAGKSLSDVFKSLLADIAKIVVRKTVTEPLGKVFTDILGGVFSGSGGSGAGANAGLAAGLDDFFRASGGPVSAGSPYIVGERGPELIVPQTSGTVIPNHALGVQKGGANFTYAPSINIDSRADIAQVRQIVDRQLRGGFAQFTDQMATAGVI